MRRNLAIWVTVLLTAVGAASSARPQGAILESMDQLKDRPTTPSFRGALPSRVDLAATLPPVRDQGPTSTCTSWASTYAAASQAERRAGRGQALALSPAFTYNKIAGDRFCNAGTQLSTTLDLLRDVGAVPIDEYVFDAGSCTRQPTAAELQRAATFRIKGWSHFDAADLNAIKGQLARGVPVLFGLATSRPFERFHGDTVFNDATKGDGSHAMIVIGYDDARQAFRIQNSWGRDWGDGGYAWVAYDFWKRNVTGPAYVID
jgi:C1A family cysteine protease